MKKSKGFSSRNGNMLDNIQKNIGTEKVTASSPGKMKKGGMVSQKKPLPKAFIGAIAAVPAVIGAGMLGNKVKKKAMSDIKEVGPMLGAMTGVPGMGAAAGGAGAAGGMGGLGSMLGGIPGMKKGGIVKKKMGKKK